MTYSEAQDIARYLANRDTKAAKWLRKMCAQIHRVPTFVIMRYGDPRQWRALPTPQDRRREFRYRSKYTRLRPCTLTNLEGKVVRARSIAEFCDKAGLNKISDRMHVSPVLDGQRPSFKGWYLPETLNREVELRDVYGNVTKHTVRDLLKRGMGQSTITRLLDGRMKTGLGDRIKMADAPHDPHLVPRQIQLTKVKLTDGKRVFTGTSLPDAARKAGITNIRYLYSAAYGFRDEVQGIRIKEIEAQTRRIL